MSISRSDLTTMLSTAPIPSYNSLITQRGYRYDRGVVWTNNQCFYTSLFNNTHAFARFQLHLVYGSLGVGKRSPFFEFGGADFNTLNDFMSSGATNVDRAGRVSLDAHVWLEDNNGKIYDVCTDHMRRVCEIRRLDPIQSNITIITGVEKSRLQGAGIWHVAAPSSVQQQLAQVFHSSWYETYELHMSHLYQRVYDINRPAL